MIRRKDDPFLFWMVGTHLVVYEIISVLRLTNVRIVRQFYAVFYGSEFRQFLLYILGKLKRFERVKMGI